MTDKINNLVTALTEILEESNSTSKENIIENFRFNGESSGNGLLWTAKDYTKQFVYNQKPNRFFSSESIDLAKNKEISINTVKVLDNESLGPTVTKSNLREVGRLKGLQVDGGMVVNQFLYYDASTDRLGLGTDQPNSALSIVDMGTEIVLGAREFNDAEVGTFNNTPLHLITDNTPRISISAGGDITLGNLNSGPIKVSVNGSLGVNVNNIDSRAKLHVNGPIKFNDNLHLKGAEPPRAGSYNLGDIMWNDNPQQKKYVGWVCTQAGNPGIWNPFGEIR